MVDNNYIKSIIQEVINNEFKQTAKKKIIEYPNRFQFACPYCGDSKNEYKKRCNIYLDHLHVICFNCGIKKSFHRMCKDFSIRIDPHKKIEIINYLNSVTTFREYENALLETEFNELINIKDVSRIFNSGEFNITDFEPVKENSGVYKNLTGRGIPPQYHKYIYQAKYWIGENSFEYIMCFLNMKDDKVLGMQTRNLKVGKNRRFLIYNYETLSKWTKGIDELDMDMDKLIIYNKLSYYFNILNVNFDIDITIFEGYLDSLFFPNSIGMVGTETDLSFLENNDLSLRYFYDNDDAGNRKSYQKIKNGYPVFLWKKLFKFITDKKSSDDPYKFENKISKSVKDLNKLAEIINNPYRKLKMEDFFSTDMYDVQWIPKQKILNNKYVYKNQKN